MLINISCLLHLNTSVTCFDDYVDIYSQLSRFHGLRLTTFRLYGYERVYLPLYRVTDTPLHIQVDDFLRVATLLKQT